MSHRDQILKRLEEAGQRGVHSFQLLDITPRYAARICELNKLGNNISSVPEKSSEALGVRYTLNVGSSTEGRDQAPLTAQPVDKTLGVASGVGWPEGNSPVLSGATPASSPYDPFGDFS